MLLPPSANRSFCVLQFARSLLIWFGPSGPASTQTWLSPCPGASEPEISCLGFREGRSAALDINNLNQVVGGSADRAFIWTAEERMVDLGTLLGHSWSYAWAINDVSQVVGTTIGAFETRLRFFGTRPKGWRTSGLCPGSPGVG